MADMNTAPGGQSAAEIEREVNAERERVSETIDALQDRMSVGSIVDQVVSSLGEHGGEAGRNLGRTVRDNPLPLLLTGVGLAWLIAGSGSSSRSDYYDERDWDDDGRLAGIRNYGVGDRPPSSTAPRSPSSLPASGPDNTPDRVAGTDAGDSGKGIGDTVKDATGRVRDAASGLADDARRQGRDLTDAARDTLGDLSARAGDGADAARRSAAEMPYRAERHGRRAQQSMAQMFDDQPLVFGALAMAAGAAVAAALPRSRTEDELFGEHRDRLVETARDVAEEEGRKLRDTAAAVADEADKIVDEKAEALDGNTPEGGSLVDKAEAEAREAADRLTKRAKDEAGRQNLGNRDIPS